MTRTIPTLAHVLALAAMLAVLPGTGVRGDAGSGRQALLKGEWAEAETAFKAAMSTQEGAARLGLAELYLLTGRHAEALEQATQASLLPQVKGAALCLAGEIFRETGRLGDARRMFRAAMEASPPRETFLRARVYLGIAQRESGQLQPGEKQPGEKALEPFFQEFNAGKISSESGEQLAYTAMAARYLGAWQDASDTFQSAVEKDPNFLLASLEAGDLFLLKYNAQEAANSFTAALKINRHHPRALVGMARARVEAAYDVTGALRLVAQALKSNPKYVPALTLKAQLSLDDEQFAAAEQVLKEALATNPGDLDALALFAASRYLQDDAAGYESYRQQALKLNPRYSDLYFIVGELAVRHHRYADGVKLNRQAVALDPQNPSALSALGSNLLRLGLANEPEGLRHLRKAFELDPFNVRTFNTLQLYEEVIAREYVTVPGGIFTYRYNKKERPLLHRYVPRLMQSAWDRYTAKYAFTPRHPIDVELFTERQHYGARTIGLPELGAQGTCFGQLITAMSPSSREASWELVLAHELAHVFHLQLSANRVSRWFTEGLAEYETNVVHPYWKREHAREIFLALRRGNLWKISELSRAFVRPDRPDGVTIAYQQSSLVIHYLVEQYGFPKIVAALKMYAQGKHDAEILPAVTGKPLEKLDEEFRAYLQKRYAHYATGFLPDPAAHADADAAKSAADAKPGDPDALAGYAAALLARDPMAAAEAARKALAADGRHLLARFTLAESLLKQGDAAGARPEYEALIAAGGDGYAPRFALGRIAAAAGDVEGAARHMAEAKRWDPDRADPYALMMELYEAKERREDLLKEAEAYLDVQEHDYDAARLLVDRLALDRRWSDLVRVAPRVLAITPMEAFVHHQYGTALAALKRPREAISELESALIGGVRRPGPLRALLAAQYLAVGDRAKAKALAEQALKEAPGNPDAAALLRMLR